jgi:hypothetical protein
MLKRITIAALALSLLTACTPEQLAVLEEHTGPITPDARQTLLGLPDDVLVISGVEVHPDGSRVERKAPAGSKCPQHYGAAMRAGWKADHWQKLDAIMWRESRCKPTAFNGNRGTGDHSLGAVQINLLAHKSWVGPMVGWDFTRLYNVETNLRVAKVLYDKCGWGPWTKPYWCRKP